MYIYIYVYTYIYIYIHMYIYICNMYIWLLINTCYNLWIGIYIRPATGGRAEDSQYPRGETEPAQLIPRRPWYSRSWENISEYLGSNYSLYMFIYCSLFQFCQSFRMCLVVVQYMVFV